jgi:hypothetical protein
MWPSMEAGSTAACGSLDEDALVELDLADAEEDSEEDLEELVSLLVSLDSLVSLVALLLLLALVSPVSLVALLRLPALVSLAPEEEESSWLAGFWQEASNNAEATNATEYCTLRRRRGLDISTHFSSVVSVTYLIPR